MKHCAIPECGGALYLARAYQVCAAPGAGLAALRQDLAAAERSIAAAYRELRQLRILDPVAGPPVPFEVTFERTTWDAYLAELKKL